MADGEFRAPASEQLDVEEGEEEDIERRHPAVSAAVALTRGPKADLKK